MDLASSWTERGGSRAAVARLAVRPDCRSSPDLPALRRRHWLLGALGACACHNRGARRRRHRGVAARRAGAGARAVALGAAATRPWHRPANALPVVGNPSAWQALVGVRSTPPGDAAISRCGPPRRRRTQATAVAPPKAGPRAEARGVAHHVDLSAEDEARYQRERTQYRRADGAVRQRTAAAHAGHACRRRAAAFGLRRVQRPVAQSAQRHGHRHAGTGTAGGGTAAGPGDRHRRLLLQRPHGMVRPRRRAADDVTATWPHRRWPGDRLA